MRFTGYQPCQVRILFVVLVLGLTSLMLASCDGGNPTPLPPPPPTFEPPPPTTAAPATTAPADLRLGETRVEPNKDANDTWNNYQIVATIVNEGAGDASGFNAGCTYQCLPGGPTISGGLDIVQAGFISAKSRFTYRNPFHYACIGHPPTLNLTCTIRLKEGSEKSYSVNVESP